MGIWMSHLVRPSLASVPGGQRRSSERSLLPSAQCDGGDDSHPRRHERERVLLRDGFGGGAIAAPWKRARGGNADERPPSRLPLRFAAGDLCVGKEGLHRRSQRFASRRVSEDARFGRRGAAKKRAARSA